MEVGFSAFSGIGTAAGSIHYYFGHPMRYRGGVVFAETPPAGRFTAKMIPKLLPDQTKKTFLVKLGCCFEGFASTVLDGRQARTEGRFRGRDPNTNAPPVAPKLHSSLAKRIFFLKSGCNFKVFATIRFLDGEGAPKPYRGPFSRKCSK